jgi:hypothetical protein
MGREAAVFHAEVVLVTEEVRDLPLFDTETEADVRPQSEDFDARVTSIAVLAEPVRRSLYRFVIGKSEPVSREEAAIGTDVVIHTANFIWTSWLMTGLLDVEYRRPPGRGGLDAPGRIEDLPWRDR